MILALKGLFALTSVVSFFGFYKAKTLHASDGPTRVMVNFSIFMAYAFIGYLGAAAALAAVSFGAHQTGRAAAFTLCLVVPFALAAWGESYDRGPTVFNLQMLALLLSLAALA